jgi:PAS domain S-box-containing protein
MSLRRSHPNDDHWAGPLSAVPSQDRATERYESIFTHHPHAAYSVDRRGYYTEANDRALEMTGLSLEQMRRTHFTEVIHPDDLPLLRDGFERALSGEPQIIDARVQRADGEVVDIRCTAIPDVLGGEIVGVHGITEDVTEARRLVRELEQANAAKLLFLATVSHEVRTPLASLVGASELLMDADLDPEARHYAAIVHRSSARLTRVAEDILDFSGLEAHQTTLRHRPFEVRAVVEDVASWAGPLAEERGLTLSCHVDDSVPVTAVGDSRRVSQVLTNLVHNAISFTEDGSVTVHARSRPDPDSDGDVDGGGGAPGTWIELEVSDTGIGIAAQHLDVLFEPFTLVDPCPARARQGIGLGLAICREVVDLMDGQLRARSTPEQGSTFTFGFPLALDADEGGPS